MVRIILKPGEEKRLYAGHPWIYDNEIAAVLDKQGKEAELDAGALVEVETDKKRYVGRAFANPNSKIRARLFSPSKEGVDLGFFKRRLRAAIEYRRFFYDLSRDSTRLCFAEADFLPGLIIDRYVGWPSDDALSSKALATGEFTFDECAKRLGAPSSWLVCQFLSFGMDSRKALILEALKEIMSASEAKPGEASESIELPKGMIERDNAAVRELEGLERREGLLEGAIPEQGILIFENGLPFIVDILSGQKTGHFLDQASNRALAARYAKGCRVLDACCHTGGFAIHSAKAGAAELIALDSSETALAAAQRNIRVNGLSERISTVKDNVFEYLRQAERKGSSFDLIILDPPAFAKSRSDLAGAERGYKEINLRAIKLLARGGTLISCSCSYALSESRLKQLIAEAAVDADRRLRLIETRYQAPDHPIRVGYDESLYLKCLVYKRV